MDMDLDGKKDDNKSATAEGSLAVSLSAARNMCPTTNLPTTARGGFDLNEYAVVEQALSQSEGQSARQCTSGESKQTYEQSLQNLLRLQEDLKNIERCFVKA